MSQPSAALKTNTEHPDLRSLLRENSRWLTCALIFAGLWALELHWIQQVTLVAPNIAGVKFHIFAACYRLLLDLVFCVGLTFLLPRWCLAIIVPIVTACLLGLVIYSNYFNQPFSILTLFYQSGEGWKVRKYIWALIPWSIARPLLAVLVGQWIALFMARRPRFSWRQLGGGMAVFFTAYIALFLVANQIDPMQRIMTKRGVARLGLMRGYMDTWAAEWYYLTDASVLERAVARRREVHDKLSPLEADIPIAAPVVVIQCESLDFNIVNHRVNDKELTPFLNKLKQTSMFYRIRAMHSQGTADADFGTLCGYAPSGDVITYNIPNYPYENTLPQLMKKHGFHAESLHGYFGSFYNRRFAYQKIGFDDDYFLEELEQKYHFPVTELGILDRDLLQLSAKQLKEGKDRKFQFIITMSTHGPFNVIAESEREVFPDHPTLSQNYLNSIRYLDHCLEEWYGQLPEGTTVMLYGDQAADVAEGDFHPDRDPQTHEEYAPCFIFKKGADFAKLQKTRTSPVSLNGDLSLLDLIWYFRGQVQKSFDKSNASDNHASSTPGNAEPTSINSAAK